MEDFSKKQISTLRAVISEVVDDSARINNDILRQEIRASETRIKTELRQEFKHDLAQMKDEIVTGVAQILEGHTLPTLDNHEARLTKLETKMA